MEVSRSGKKRLRPTTEIVSNAPIHASTASAATSQVVAVAPASTASSHLSASAADETAPTIVQGSAKRRSGVPAALQPAALAAWEAAERRKGVVYLGRIPPYMRPVTLRQRLSAHGELGRMHLSAEDPTAASRRIKAGGCKKTRFVEGWVEFLDKADAKAAAALLHNQAMGTCTRRKCSGPRTGVN